MVSATARAACEAPAPVPHITLKDNTLARPMPTRILRNVRMEVLLVCRASHIARLQRTVVAIGIVWLLVLPFIPWRTDKVLVLQYFLLVPGMTTTQVQTIMGAFPGIHNMSKSGYIFCGDPDWNDGECTFSATAVHINMENDRVISTDFHWD
jgi:hypothetical protein